MGIIHYHTQIHVNKRAHTVHVFNNNNMNIINDEIYFVVKVMKTTTFFNLKCLQLTEIHKNNFFYSILISMHEITSSIICQCTFSEFYRFIVF